MLLLAVLYLCWLFSPVVALAPLGVGNHHGVWEAGIVGLGLQQAFGQQRVVGRVADKAGMLAGGTAHLLGVAYDVDDGILHIEQNLVVV